MTFIFLKKQNKTKQNTCGPPQGLCTVSVIFSGVKKATASFDKEGKSTNIITTAAQVTREHGSV